MLKIHAIFCVVNLIHVQRYNQLKKGLGHLYYFTIVCILFLAEYILSLANLKWDTFNNAITEKYCDLFWQEDLLSGLYESVNGQKPHPPRYIHEPITIITVSLLNS